MNSTSFYFTKVFIKAFGAYDNGSRKLKKTILSIAVDCCRQNRLCWIVCIEHSQRGRRLKVFGLRKERARVRETRECIDTRVSLTLPVLSLAHYFQAPATQPFFEQQGIVRCHIWRQIHPSKFSVICTPSIIGKICVTFNYNTARKFAKSSTTLRVFTKYRKSAYIRPLPTPLFLRTPPQRC